MKRKTTIYVEDGLLRALKIAAARTGQHDYELVEQALRTYLGMELLEKIGSKSRLGEKQALSLAYKELHRSRNR